MAQGGPQRAHRVGGVLRLAGDPAVTGPRAGARIDRWGSPGAEGTNLILRWASRCWPGAGVRWACARLAVAGHRHGRRPVRRSLCHPRPALRQRAPQCHHGHHLDRRLCQHRGLASSPPRWSTAWVARRLLGLGGVASADRFAAQCQPAPGGRRTTSKPVPRRWQSIRCENSGSPRPRQPAHRRPAGLGVCGGGLHQHGTRCAPADLLALQGVSATGVVLAGSFDRASPGSGALAGVWRAAAPAPLVSGRVAACMHPLAATLLMLLGAPAAAGFCAAARRGQWRADHHARNAAAGPSGPPGMASVRAG